MNMTALAILSATLSVGQASPATPHGGEYLVTSKKTLQLGIDYKPERKREIRTCLLYMSRDMGSTWELVAQEPPTKEAFTFTAPGDGVYFLNMMITYLDGKTDPADLTKQTPAQKLIVDSTKPIVGISSAQWTGDVISIEWTIEDKNPNDASTRIFYRPVASDNTAWQTAPLESMTRRSAKFQPMMTGPLLVQVVTADLAGNVGSATREVAVATTSTSTSNLSPASGIGPPPVVPKSLSETGPIAPNITAEPSAPKAPLTPTLPTSTSLPTSSNVGTPAAGSPTLPGLEPLSGTNPQGAMPIVIDPPARPIAISGGPTPSVGAMMPAPEVSPIQYSKSPRFELGYQLEAGPSGVARIELYVTRDDGKNWVRWSSHDGRETPLKIALDTRFNQDVDGEYGFRLVPISGAGLSEGAPAPGSAPEARVQVDTQAPVIKVFQPTADPKQKNALLLLWEATDKNFGKDPIAIEYSESATGPWKSVQNGEGFVPASVGAASRIANTGSYSWQLPLNLTTPRVYLKFTAWDLAGNRSEVTTPHPILVDLMKPKARVQGISVVTGR